MDAARSGNAIGVGILVSLCSALLDRSVKGGLVVVGEIALVGSIESVHNPISIAELALEKGAQILLIPVSCRRQLVDLSDEVATKLQLSYYADAADALRKALVE